MQQIQKLMNEYSENHKCLKLRIKQGLMIIEIGPIIGPITAQKSVGLKNYYHRCFGGLLRVSVRDKLNLYDRNWRNYPFGIKQKIFSLNQIYRKFMRYKEEGLRAKEYRTKVLKCCSLTG